MALQVQWNGLGMEFNESQINIMNFLSFPFEHAGQTITRNKRVMEVIFAWLIDDLVPLELIILLVKFAAKPAVALLKTT